jgi:hypothetical protein
MAFLTSLIIIKRELPLVLVFELWVRICGDVVMAGFAFDTLIAVYGMIQLILRYIQGKFFATGEGHA